tara:strand:- start:289 stop:453 length:165 start_codon:yes stop_codon:yes gene_type:complete
MVEIMIARKNVKACTVLQGSQKKKRKIVEQKGQHSRGGSKSKFNLNNYESKGLT